MISILKFSASMSFLLILYLFTCLFSIFNFFSTGLRQQRNEKEKTGRQRRKNEYLSKSQSLIYGSLHYLLTTILLYTYPQ